MRPRGPFLAWQLVRWLFVAAFCFGLSNACCGTIEAAEIPTSPTLISITVKPAHSSIAAGYSRQFEAIGNYSNGRSKNITSSVTWSSSHTNVATISSSGLAQGVAVGRSQISATLDSIVGTAALTVTPAVLISIKVTPQGAMIAVNSMQQFMATGNYSDGSSQNITTSVTWRSSATTIAMINAAGLATGEDGVAQGGTGQSTIGATLASVNGTSNLTVTNYLASLAVTPNPATLPQVGSQQAFTARGTYQDGSSADLSSNAAWASGNACVLGIVTGGTATAAGIGTVTVTASYASGSGTNVIGTSTATVGTPPPPSGPIPASFFGMTIGDNGMAYSYPLMSNPAIPIGAIGHPTELAWAEIEPNQGTFDFTLYDQYAMWSAQYGVPFTVTFGWTPYWAVSSAWQNSQYCHPELNWCGAPPENNSDWTDFLNTVVTHYNGTNGLPKIQYYEVWNEANDPGSWVPASADPNSLLGLAQLANLASQIIRPASLLGAPSVTDVVGGAAQESQWLAQYLQTIVETQDGPKPASQFAAFGSFHGYLAPQGTSPFPFPEDCTSSSSGSYDDVVTHALTIRSVLNANGISTMFDSEGSWGENNVTDSSQQVAWLARWYLLQAGTQVTQSATWFAWGLSTPAKEFPTDQWGLITDDCPGDLCTPTSAGIAYGQVYDWLVGSTISPCSSVADTSAPGNFIWSCQIVNSSNQTELAIWYHSPQEASVFTYMPSSQFMHYKDLAGNVNTITGNPPSVTISAQPILLTP